MRFKSFNDWSDLVLVIEKLDGTIYMISSRHPAKVIDWILPRAEIGARAGLEAHAAGEERAPYMHVARDNTARSKHRVYNQVIIESRPLFQAMLLNHPNWIIIPKTSNSFLS